MSDFEYVVMTPVQVRGSAGTKFLYDLTDDIRATGRKAHRIYLVSSNKGLAISQDSKDWFLSTPELIKEWAGNPEKCIVIHGENQDCANFMGMNVARYYLNKIGALRKVGIPREGEFKIAWDVSFCDNPHHVLRTCTLRYPLDAAKHIPLDNRQIDLTYIGKASIKNPNLSRIPHTLELKKDWPNNDDEYFYLLKNTRRLYSYDAVTSVMNDAIELGAMPVLMINDMKAVQWAKDQTLGCVAHVDDDLDKARDIFEIMRPDYLKLEQNLFDQYKQNLEECCLRMEQYFGEV